MIRFAFTSQNLSQVSADVVNILASCHNLIRVNGKVTGNHLEEELFKQTGYVRYFLCDYSCIYIYKELKRDKLKEGFIVHPPPAFNDRGVCSSTTC